MNKSFSLLPSTYLFQNIMCSSLLRLMTFCVAFLPGYPLKLDDGWWLDPVIRISQFKIFSENETCIKSARFTVSFGEILFMQLVLQYYFELWNRMASLLFILQTKKWNRAMLAFPIGTESLFINNCFEMNKKPQHGIAHQGMGWMLECSWCGRSQKGKVVNALSH